MAKFFALALLSVCFAVFVVVSGEDKECIRRKLLHESLGACKDKISDENLKLLMENEEFTNAEIECFQACILQYNKFLKDGKIDVEVAYSKIKENIDDPVKAEMMKNIIETCTKQAEGGENDCKVAGAWSQCMAKAKKAVQSGQK